MENQVFKLIQLGTLAWGWFSILQRPGTFYAEKWSIEPTQFRWDQDLFELNGDTLDSTKLDSSDKHSIVVRLYKLTQFCQSKPRIYHPTFNPDC